MNYLNEKTVYLAGPMHAVEDDGVGWREEIAPLLKKKFGIVAIDPSKRKTIDGRVEIKDDKKYFKELIKNKNFKELKEVFYKVVRKDLKEVDRADLIVAYYNPGVHMFGTIHEMIIASQQKKPILVKYDEEKLDEINPWLFTLIKDNWAFSKWEDMFAYLEEINNGNIDTSHWW